MIFFYLKKYGVILSFVFLFLFSIYSKSAFALDYNQAVKKAEQLHLSEKRYWHILMHYSQSLTGYKSRIDDPLFFLAENGKNNPNKELKQTIKKLFYSEKKQEYICRFYARYKWIKQNLDPDNIFFEEINCSNIDKIKPGTVSLIFPTYYMNNPASMFGHTFLTINTDYENMRLADSINYAARANTRNGINFAIRGIFGLFKGYYAVMPYYKKIEEYSDINQRDIWEYKLNLKPDEVQKMIWHITELNQIYTDYYFFKENCSYNILYLLEAARPSLNLASQFKTVVIPIDTIKAMKKENLIDGVNFRPSKATKIKFQMDKLSKREKQLAGKIIYEKNIHDIFNTYNIPLENQKKITTFSIDLLQYFYIEEKIAKSDYKNNFLKLLSYRSKLGKTKEKSFPPAPKQPDLYHDSNRISITAGLHNNDFFQEIRFRPAFTDINDTDYILDKGAQIEFLDTKIRYDHEKESLKLNQLEFLDIKSISPRNKFFKPISWMINTGLARKFNHNHQEKLIYQINTGGGVAYNLFNNNNIIYSMIEQQSEFGGNLEYNFDMGLGSSVGLISRLNDYNKIHLSSKIMKYLFTDYTPVLQTSFAYNHKLSVNNHLEFEYNYKKEDHVTNSATSLSWHIFF